MKILSNCYNYIHKRIQESMAGYDTFHTFRKSKNGKKLEHRKARRVLKQEKFYEGYEEFLRENSKRILNNEKE